jgi:hypothetical protein
VVRFRRSNLSPALDWLALALVLAALAISLRGGFSSQLGGVRVTARDPDRAIVAALVLIAIRVVLDRRTWPLAPTGSVLRRVRDRFRRRWLYRADGDAVEALPVASAWRRRAIAAVGLCTFGAVLLLPQLRRMDSVPDLGDPLFSIWRIGWVHHKLIGDPRPLFSPNIFHPHQFTLTYSDSMLLPAVTTVPLLAVGLHPVTAYNLALVCSFVVSAFAMYLLVERLTGSPGAAFVSALLFGFYPYRFEHYSHFELQMTYCMPLALLALHRFLTTARVRDAAAAAVLTAGQLYSSMYYAVFFTFYAGALLLILGLLSRPRMRTLLVPATIAGAVALLLAYPLARTYSAAHLGDRDVPTVSYYSATASDYLRAHPRSAMWAERGLPGRRAERALFPGVMALLLAAIALIPPLGATRAAYAGALLVAFEISRGFNGPIYPYLYEWLPFVRGLRVPARSSLLVGLSLAVLAGFGVRRLLAGRSRPVTRAVLAALTVAIAIDLWPALRLEPVWREPPPIYGLAAGSQDVVLAEFPFGGRHARFTANVPFMYFSLWHWARMINGYSGRYPPGHLEFETAMGEFPDPPTVDLLRARGATHVSVNCALYPGDCDDLFKTLDAMPAFRVVSSGKWQGQPVRLYELKR